MRGSGFFLGLAIGACAAYGLLHSQGLVGDAAALSLVLKAADFAAKKHKDQKRKDPDATPYINHPIGVAWSLIWEGGVLDARCLAAALLHDTVEDTDTTLDEIEEHFGVEVRDVVAEVTDDKTLPKAERKRRQVESAPTKSLSAKMLKMADLLYNLRDLQRVIPAEWTRERALEYFDWGERVYRGLKGANPQLEEKLEHVFKTRIP